MKQSMASPQSDLCFEAQMFYRDLVPAKSHFSKSAGRDFCQYSQEPTKMGTSDGREQVA